MAKILNEVRSLIYENSLVSGGAVAIAGLLGLAIGLGTPLLIALAKTILEYLIFVLVVTGFLNLSNLTLSKIKLITDLDEFITENFDRLKASGYNNIDSIEKKAINARNAIVLNCKDGAYKKDGFELLKSECAKTALVAYMETCLIELYSYYIRLLMAKQIRMEKATSLEYILSSKEDPIFNLVLSKITFRFTEILKLLNEDVDSFKYKILKGAKQNNINLSHDNPRRPDSNRFKNPTFTRN